MSGHVRQILILFLATWTIEASREPHTYSEGKTRIIGGTEASDGELPFLVSLRVRNNRAQGFHICGGSIIHKNWILTAAHCVLNLKPSNLIVVAGSNSLKSGGDKYNVSKIIKHEKHNDTIKINDIALLKLSKDVKFGSKVLKIALPSENTPGNLVMVTAGWGYINNNKTKPDKLQKLSVLSLNIRDCKYALQSVRDVPFTDNQICTFRDFGKGICQGDSGGALIYKSEIVGITSWNIPCAQGYPDVFTRVFSYVQWIKQKIANN